MLRDLFRAFLDFGVDLAFVEDDLEVEEVDLDVEEVDLEVVVLEEAVAATAALLLTLVRPLVVALAFVDFPTVVGSSETVTGEDWVPFRSREPVRGRLGSGGREAEVLLDPCSFLSRACRLNL